MKKLTLFTVLFTIFAFASCDTTGVPEGAIPSKNKVTLKFDHKLSKIIININNQTDGTIGDVYFTDVNGKLNWNFETITPIDGTGRIKPAALTTPATGYTNSYALIIPPQIATPTIAIVIGEKQYNFTAEQAYTFTSGKKRTVNIIVKGTSIFVTFDDIGNDWTADEDMNFNQKGITEIPFLFRRNGYNPDAEEEIIYEWN